MTKLCDTCEYLKFCARSGIEEIGCDRYKEDRTTNEEFMRSVATTDELAEIIYEWYVAGYTKGRLDLGMNPVTEITAWLKKQHLKV